MLFKFFAHFKKLWFLSSSYYPGYKSFIKYEFCKYFLPVRGLYFHFLNSVLQRTVFNFDGLQFIIFSFIVHVSGLSLRYLCITQNWHFPVLSFRNLIVSGFIYVCHPFLVDFAYTVDLWIMWGWGEPIPLHSWKSTRNFWLCKNLTIVLPPNLWFLTVDQIGWPLNNTGF